MERHWIHSRLSLFCLQDHFCKKTSGHHTSPSLSTAFTHPAPPKALLLQKWMKMSYEHRGPQRRGRKEEELCRHLMDIQHSLSVLCIIVTCYAVTLTIWNYEFEVYNVCESSASSPVPFPICENYFRCTSVRVNVLKTSFVMT